jgi:hypothetical protein
VLDSARARAAGDDIRSVIAGYHWFTDWGRDTMISLEGLLLHTGRHAEAACILRMFARHMKDGLIPNLFPEGHQEGLYHAADATLWLFHALGRYVDATGDWDSVAELLPAVVEWNRTFLGPLARHPRIQCALPTHRVGRPARCRGAPWLRPPGPERGPSSCSKPRPTQIRSVAPPRASLRTGPPSTEDRATGEGADQLGEEGRRARSEHGGRFISAP